MYYAPSYKKVVMHMIKMPDGSLLAQEMTGALPLYCYADKPVSQLLMKRGVSIGEKTRLKIVDVQYMGEAGGITCVVERPEGGGVLAISATQARFSDDGAVYDKINEYREARIHWLRQEELKDKILGRGGRITVIDANKDGSMRFSGDDGTEIITLPKESAKQVAPKISRNSPCPCGSGKKYKKCCGARLP